MFEVCGIHVPDEWFAKQIKNGNGIFDRASFEMCEKHITNRRTVLDVGGHYGTWAVGFANLGFENVHSFEPVTKIYNVLEKNSEPYATITPYNSGISSNKRRVAFEVGEDNSGQGHVAINHKAGDIQLNSIDSYNFKNVDFIKLDVEGYEFYALDGARKTIAQWKPLICIELNGLAARYGLNDNDLVVMLNDMGYNKIAQNNKDYLFKHKRSI